MADEPEINTSRAPYLLRTAKVVLLAFRAGRNPTFEQLDKLEAAIEGCEAMKICGHLLDEDCECV